MYKKTLFILIVLIILFILYNLFQPKIKIKINNKDIEIKAASTFGSKMEISIGENKDKSLMYILHTNFDYPLFFYPNKNNSLIYVVYWFDIEVHVFALEIDKNIKNIGMIPLNKSLKKIILLTKNFNVLPVADKDIDYIIYNLKRMSNNEYHNFSIPSIYLGIYKRYFNKNKLIKILSQKLEKNTISANIIQSKLNNPWP